MDKDKLSNIAKKLVASHKGILAADESNPTIKKRFDSIDIESTENNRRDYRELLFSTKGIEDYISGIILYEETLYQKSSKGQLLSELLQSKDVIPGIKVDKSAKDFIGFPGEKITEGLDGLYDRMKNFHDDGARFSKWRAVITIGDQIPSAQCIELNAVLLARYAITSQEAGLVPIVEPEVLRDGGHDIDRCYEVTEETLREVFSQLVKQKVLLEGMLLKPSMVISGGSAVKRAGAEEVAEKTIECFKRSLPASVPGVVFLSGGEPDDSVTENLNALNQGADRLGAPWELSFSFGRSLQGEPLKTWVGKAENIEAAATAFYTRARLTGAARRGEYTS